MNLVDGIGSALQKEIHDALIRKLGEGAATIGVVVDGEVATLTGHTSTLSTKWSAEEAARTTAAAAVVNEIRVQLSADDEVPDERLARSVLEALKWDARLPLRGVHVTVEDGCVSLMGTVDWQYQVASATEAAAQVQGIRALSNQLESKPRVSPKDVQAEIRAAFERGAVLDASHIIVAVRGGVVILTGYVRTMAEREDAEAAARATPGVVEVENHLRIANW